MLEAKYNIANSLGERLPQIIEAFVKFYGEDERERITQKLTEASYIGYLRLDDYSTLEYNCKESIGFEVGKMFVEKIGLEPTKENVKRLVGEGVGTFSDRLGNFYENYGASKEWQQNSALRYIQEAFGDESVTIGSPEYQEYADVLLSYKPAYEEALALYNERLKVFQPYFELHKELENLQKRINQKYQAKYLEAISEYLPEEDKTKMDEEYLFNLDCYETLVGFSWDSKCLLDAFSSESSEKLEDPKVVDFIKNNIVEDRIKYYKKMGLDLGDDYEDYVESKKAQAITPSPEMVAKIIGIREDLAKKRTNELYKSLPTFIALREKLDKIGLLNKSDGLLRNVRDGATCICPNLCYVDGKLVVHPIMYISGATDTDYMDCRIIHECNHIYELSLLNFDGENAEFCSGWDIVKDGMMSSAEEEETYEDDGSHRDFELLNEIINELIAQDITRIMHEANVSLYGDPKTAKNDGATSYQYAARLVYEFYEEYKDVIIESRKNRNLDVLFNKIGRENFEALNDLVHEYLEYFVGFKLYSTLDALRAGQENDDTRYYKEATRRSKEIMERIRNHKIESSFRL